MKKGKYQNNTSSHAPVIYGIMMVIIVVLLSIIIILLSNNRILSQNPELDATSETTPETTVEKNPDSIAVPGYEMLQLKADTKQQTLSLPNPAQNMCYFQISLYLEDGTLLWESELIEPGDVSKPIILKQTLKKGTYPNAVLRYSCFRMDASLSPLNGAEAKLTLLVQ